MSDQEKEEKPEADAAKEEAKSDTHPMCESAPDKEKCEEFVERLDEAGNNINLKND